MPKIIIKEKDYTTAEPREYDDYVAFVPGLSVLKEAGTEELFEDAAKFESTIGAATTGIGYEYALRLLKLGMKVFYVVFADEGTLISTLKGTYANFWKKYEDKSLFDLRFITSGGYGLDSVSGGENTDAKAIAQNMIKCAAERGDAYAVVDVPFDRTSETQIDAWCNSLEVSDVIRDSEVTEEAFKYSAAFANSFTCKGRGAEAPRLPASFGYLACFGKYIKNYADWFAMAGSVRGVIPFANVETFEKYGDAAIDVLQDRTTEGHMACNVIYNMRPYGQVIYGNRTLHALEADNETGTIGLKASDFLNIRNICCDIKKTLYRACRRFLFEPNSDTLWVRFSNEITPLLESMKSGQGIKGYKLIRKVNKKKATLTAAINIIPIEAVEDFDLTLNLTDSIEITE